MSNATTEAPANPHQAGTAKPIAGYRKMSDEEVALVNRLKAKAEECGALVAELRTCQTRGPDETKPMCDQRWVSIGQTDLQTGFMALVRAVAQPTTF